MHARALFKARFRDSAVDGAAMSYLKRKRGSELPLGTCLSKETRTKKGADESGSLALFRAVANPDKRYSRNAFTPGYSPRDNLYGGTYEEEEINAHDQRRR